jgi:hypothetical protein
MPPDPPLVLQTLRFFPVFPVRQRFLQLLHVVPAFLFCSRWLRPLRDHPAARHVTNSP